MLMLIIDTTLVSGAPAQRLRCMRGAENLIIVVNIQLYIEIFNTTTPPSQTLRHQT